MHAPLPPKLLELMETLDRLQPLQRLTENINQVQKMVQNTPRITDAYAQALQHQYEVLRQYDVVNEQWRAAIEAATIVTDKYRLAGLELLESCRRWAEQLREYEDVATRYGPTMLALGWPPSSEPPLDEMKHVLELYDTFSKDEAKQELQTVMLLWYNRDVVLNLLEQWAQKPRLVRRMPIVTDAVMAHVEERYRLSIPVLIAQIEGMIADGFGHQGYMNLNVYKKYLEDLLGSGQSQDLDRCVKEFTLQTVLASFQHGSPISSELSRHAILHGADSEYGTAANSLKAILLFDYLQAALYDREGKRSELESPSDQQK